MNGGSRATIKYQNLIGDRYLEISDGPGDPHELRSGATIPRDRTSPALDLDALIGGFRPLLKAIDPQDVNGISQALIEVFQGQGLVGGSGTAPDRAGHRTARRRGSAHRFGDREPQRRPEHRQKAERCLRSGWIPCSS